MLNPIASILAVLLLTLSTISLANLHSLLLQSAVAQQLTEGEEIQQPTKLTGNESQTIQCITTPCKYPTSQAMPPEPEIDKTVALPASNGTKPAATVDGGNNGTEPCISPCPPGQICIQMCRPIGQPETLTTTPPPSPVNTGDEGEKRLSPTPSPEQTTTKNEEQEQLQSPLQDDEDTEEGKDTTVTQQEP
jgi:hypothetical protein